LPTQGYGGPPEIPGGMTAHLPHLFSYGMTVLILGLSVPASKEGMMVKVFAA
jgi:hypothetical protein